MKRLILTTMILSMAVVPALAGDRHGRGRGHWKHHHGPRHAYYSPRPVYVAPPMYVAPPVYAAPGFGWYAPDVAYLRGYYGPRYYEPMPSGYVLAPGRPLPPGLMRRMRPIPVYVEHRLRPLPSGYARGFIGGNVVIYNRRSTIAIDIASLF